VHAIQEVYLVCELVPVLRDLAVVHDQASCNTHHIIITFIISIIIIIITSSALAQACPQSGATIGP
jgi:hypothetical protein